MSVTEIRAEIRGRDVTRSEILQWEYKRLNSSARRIGLEVPDGELADQRLAFADAKLALGSGEIRRRLSRALWVSDRVSRSTATLSRGRRAFSTCDLHVTGGNAARFADWFTDTERPDFERIMVAANPDHFLIGTDPRGDLEIIETTGGSPLPSRFFVNYEDTDSLRSPVDPRFEADASGVARSLSGLAIGGIRHQFRDTGSGFHAHLVVEFPKLLAPYMVREHEWHLAAEFANWIEFAFAD